MTASRISSLTELDDGVGLHRQHVSVEAGQVDQRPVDGVPLGPGGPRLLLLLQVLERRSRTGRLPPARADPEAAAHLLGLGGRQRRSLLVGLGGGGVHQVAGRLQRAAELAEGQRQAQDGVPAQPGVLVGGEPAGPADVTLGRAGRERRHGGVDAVPADQHLGDRLGRRGAQRQMTAARADRRSTSSTAGAHSSQTVCGVGSSIALSRALPAGSVSRSASSTTMTCHRPPEG
jgi:hypothetical protein